MDAKPRCLVYLLDTYFAKFPPNSHGLDVFYLRPKASYTSDVWYDCVPVGVHKLKNYLECMCKEAGIQEKKSNHSLRATGATALFNAGVPEKLIRGVTGHRSNALQLYERPTTEQLQETSAVPVQGKKQFHPGKENEPATTGVHIPTVTPTPAVPAPIGQFMSSDTQAPTAVLQAPTGQSLGPVAPAHLARPGLFGSFFSGVTNITVNVCANNRSSELDGLDLEQFFQF